MQEIERRIGFACLFVFARLLQQERLALNRLGSRTATPLLAHITQGTSLAEAFATCQPGTNPDIGQIGLCLARAGQDLQPGSDVPVLLWRVGEAGLDLTLVFDTANIANRSAEDFLQKIALVLTALEQTPELACGALELVTEAARPLMADLSRAIVPQNFETIPEGFFRIAAAHPAEAAIKGADQVYSYQDLSRAVCDLVANLALHGLRPGEIVAISGVASFGTYAAMIAVMAAGGVLVTLDKTLPAERLALIRQIAKPRLTIEVVGPEPHPISGDTVLLARDWPSPADIAALPHAPVRLADLAPDAAAYVFFTSGSTGVPKGVLGAQLGLSHFLAWQRDSFPIGPGDRVAQLTALSFDAVLRDLFYALTSGACLVVPDRNSLLDARRMLRWFEAERITAMHCVPSLMKAWLQAARIGQPFASLRHMFFTGEKLTDTLLHHVAEAAGPATNLVNFYGPTETTLIKLANPITRIEPGVQPVGRPQPGVDVAILSDEGRRCGLWEVGEIAIRTPYRSHGYLDRPDLTSQAFRPNPHRNDPHDMIYFTGDLGRLRPDGQIEIFGRTDSQIKIRGVRIEPSEIESRMLELPGVKDAAVALHSGAGDERILFGLVVPQSPPANQAAFTAGLREALRGKLADMMVPQRIILQDHLPYLPNGKLDRKAMASLGSAAFTADQARPVPALQHDPRMQRLIAGIEHAIGVQIDTVDATFLDLGGDSLSYVQVSILIEDLLGWLPQDWESMPISRFADLFTKTGTAKASPWVGIETSMLVRAIAIILVLMNHAAVQLPIAATSALFVVSGLAFARFLRPANRATGAMLPTLSMITKFAIPAGLWQIPRAALMHTGWWLPNMVLMGTFFENPSHPVWTFWYLDVLAANLLLMSAIGWAGHVLRPRGAAAMPSAAQAFRSDFLWVGVGLAAAAVQVLSGWWDGALGVDSVAPFKWFWMLALGVLITDADTRSRKLQVSLLVMGLMAATYCGSDTLAAIVLRVDPFFAATVGLLVWVDRIQIPRWAYRPAVSVASSTLFIYIVNNTVINHVMPKLGLPAWTMLQVGLSLVAGIAAKTIWEIAGDALPKLKLSTGRVARQMGLPFTAHHQAAPGD